MCEILLKVGCLAVAVVVGLIVFVHVLPWIIAILVVLGLVKLYHHWRQPRNGSPARWPWRDK